MKRSLTKQGLGWALFVALGLVLSQVGVADDAKKAKSGETKGATGAVATSINWAKTLGLNFASLTTLGARIEQARGAADPVGLASAAKELAAAENVAGKKAAITSADLLKEAAELAKYRYEPTELKAVAMLLGDGSESQDLLNTAKKAATFRENQRKAREAGETTRGIEGVVRFDSRTDAYISCYVNGRFVGSMGPFGDVYYFVGDAPYATTYLYARSNDGRFWRLNVHSAYSSYRWILYP